MKKHLRFALLSMVGTMLCGSAVAQTWEKTDFDQLQDGDKVIVVDLSSECSMGKDLNSKKAPKANSVTITDGVLTAGADNSLQFVVGLVDEGFTLQVDGTEEDYLYCTKDNNGVRLGAGDDNVFSIKTNDEGVGFIYNNGQARYIGVYNATDWRCYTSINNNIKNCVTAFFKYNAGGEQPVVTKAAAPVFSPDGGKVEDGTKVTLTCATEGATIFYQVGEEGMFTEYTEPFALNFGEENELQVIAYAYLADEWGMAVDGSESDWVFKIFTKDETPAFEFEHEGTLEDPFTATEAYVYASQLDANEVTDGDFFVKGIISSIANNGLFGVQYGNATFYISDDGTEEGMQFYVYRTLYLGNEKYSSTEQTNIKVGDEVVICGKLTNYRGTTPETSANNSYLYSLNGKTADDVEPQPDPEDIQATVGEALDVIAEMDDNATSYDNYEVTGYVVEIEEVSTQYGNATFTIADEKDGQNVLKVFRAKGIENQAITDENIIAVGAKVKVYGKLQPYVKNDVMTPELVSGYIVSVDMTTTGISTVSTAAEHATVYNLNGQRVSAAQKGLYIVGGKKVVMQ